MRFSKFLSAITHHHHHHHHHALHGCEFFRGGQASFGFSPAGKCLGLRELFRRLPPMKLVFTLCELVWG